MTTENRREGLRYARLLVQELLDNPNFFEVLFGDVLIDRDRLQNAWDALDEAERAIASRHAVHSPVQARPYRIHFCRRWR